MMFVALRYMYVLDLRRLAEKCKHFHVTACKLTNVLRSL